MKSSMANIYALAVTASVLIITGICLWPLMRLAYERIRRMGVVFTVGTVLALITMGTKPKITWDDYLENNKSYYLTNDVIGVHFAWTKTNQQLPNAQPLYISKMATNGTDWVLAATTYVGANSYDLALSDPQGQKYYVWHEWVPPSPVHTNGVWFGQFVEKANGSKGIDKIIIIKGQLLEHGKVIAPCQK